MPYWHINERSCQFTSVNIKISLLQMDKIVLRVLVTIWHKFFLSYNCHNHSPKRNNLWNNINTSWVNNDSICQNVNTIYCKHDVCPLPWWLGRGCWGNMRLFAPNMEPHVLNNGGKIILNHIMCGNAFSPMNTTK